MGKSIESPVERALEEWGELSWAKHGGIASALKDEPNGQRARRATFLWLANQLGEGRWRESQNNRTLRKRLYRRARPP